jgi:predicted metal-dependent hydrolase
MTIDVEHNVLSVQGIQVEVVRKDIKNLHLGVYPPNGRVRVAAPLKVSDEAVRLAVVSKLAWINRKKAAFEEQLRQSKREMITGESHYFLGQRYRMDILVAPGRPSIRIRNGSVMELQVPEDYDSLARANFLNRWYRQRLRELVPPIIEKWQMALGIEDASFGIRRMKTKWGSCNPDSRHIWLNLELAKKPVSCLEYIVLHELVHFFERTHTSRFTQLMDEHMRNWGLHREVLNSAPLAHEEWTY